MSEVLVLVDVDNTGGDGLVTKPTTELLTIARRLGEPSAVLIGGNPAAASQTLTDFGAEKIYIVDDADIKGYLVAPKAEVLAQLVEKTSPAAVLIPSGGEGKEIAGRLAVKIEAGVITDAVDVQADGGAPVTTQSVFAGEFLVRAKVRRGVPVITVKPNSVTPERAAGAGAQQTFEPTISASAKSAKIVASEPRKPSGRPELTEAAIVVAGGRGTGGNFEPVERFADSLGAAVGASRAAVDSGWVPHAFQVGQTGKTVSPQLYVAAGISGAIQHRAGMQTAKTIVAVNKDPDSPIFELVDFGVVGDLHTVLQSATDEITSRKS
jgi:electron transfer flavoprotein alpha subunit